MVISRNLSVNEFVALKLDSEIDDKIASKEREVKAIQQADEISRKSQLAKITLPSIHEFELVSLLNKTLDDISSEAIQKVQSQLVKLGENSETWIHTGLEFGLLDFCPFCGQSVTGLDLIRAYQSFFSTAYKDLKAEIDTLLRKYEKLFDESELLRITNVLAQNEELSVYWSSYISADFPSIEAEKIQDA
jgi:wobble nucleotide-excising tRNase